MTYSDFDVKKVVTDFQLELIEDRDLFSQLHEFDVSESFAHVLKYHLPLALAMNTEKARSELVLINIFMELCKGSNAYYVQNCPLENQFQPKKRNPEQQNCRRGFVKNFN